MFLRAAKTSQSSRQEGRNGLAVLYWDAIWLVSGLRRIMKRELCVNLSTTSIRVTPKIMNQNMSAFQTGFFIFFATSNSLFCAVENGLRKVPHARKYGTYFKSPFKLDLARHPPWLALSLRESLLFYAFPELKGPFPIYALNSRPNGIPRHQHVIKTRSSSLA